MNLNMFSVHFLKLRNMSMLVERKRVEGFACNERSKTSLPSYYCMFMLIIVAGCGMDVLSLDQEVGAWDSVLLDPLTEDSFIANLHQRFKRDHIYVSDKRFYCQDMVGSSCLSGC
jgi:hypothetical protein